MCVHVTVYTRMQLSLHLIMTEMLSVATDSATYFLKIHSPDALLPLLCIRNIVSYGSITLLCMQWCCQCCVYSCSATAVGFVALGLYNIDLSG